MHMNDAVFYSFLFFLAPAFFSKTKDNMRTFQIDERKRLLYLCVKLRISDSQLMAKVARFIKLEAT